MQEFNHKQKFILLLYLTVVIALILYVPYLNSGVITINGTSLFSDKVITDVHSIPDLFSVFVPQQQQRYKPFANILLKAEYTLMGDSIKFYRLISLSLHILNVLLIGRLLRKFTNAIFLVAFGMLLFTVHPIIASTIFLIEESATLITVTFLIIAVNVYLNFLKMYKRKDFILTILLLYCAFFSGGHIEILVLIAFVCYQYRTRLSIVISAISFIILLLFVPSVYQHISISQNVSIMLREVLLQEIIWMVIPLQGASGIHVVSSTHAMYFIFSLLMYTVFIYLMYKFWNFRIFSILLIGVMISIPIQQEYNEYVITDGKLYIAVVLFFIGIIFFLNRVFGQAKHNLKVIKGIMVGLLSLYFITTIATLKSFDSPQKFWTSAVHNQPSSVYFLNQSGLAELEELNYRQALKYFNLAVSEDSLNGYSYINRAIALSNTNKWNEAIENLRIAETLLPQYANIFLHKGIIYSQMGLLDSSINSFTNALTLQQGMLSAYNARANAYVQKKKYIEALADYTKAISLEPTYGEAYGNRGIIRFLLGDIPAAIRDFENNVEFIPYKVESRIHLSILKILAGDSVSAQYHLSMAKRIDSSRAISYFHVALPAFTQRYYNLDSIVIGNALQAGYQF